jgi:hypothetical protein
LMIVVCVGSSLTLDPTYVLQRGEHAQADRAR